LPHFKLGFAPFWGDYKNKLKYFENDILIFEPIWKPRKVAAKVETSEKEKYEQQY
jgi:hypothetical protein